MKLILAHSLWMLKELLRQPAYVISTVGFPSLFFLIFGVPEAIDLQKSRFLVSSFSAFAVFGVVFLQFGTSLAQERSHSWYFFLRTLPVSAWQIFLSRVICATVFSILASILVVFCALAATKLEMTFQQWIRFLSVLWLAGLVFFPMGLVLGSLTSPKSSLPVGNLFYLTLSFAGGLWMPPNILPKVVQDFSKILPTRHYGELLWAVSSGQSVPKDSVQFLVLFFLVSLGVGLFLISRDSKERSSV